MKGVKLAGTRDQRGGDAPYMRRRRVGRARWETKKTEFVSEPVTFCTWTLSCSRSEEVCHAGTLRASTMADETSNEVAVLYFLVARSSKVGASLKGGDLLGFQDEIAMAETVLLTTTRSVGCRGRGRGDKLWKDSKELCLRIVGGRGGVDETRLMGDGGGVCASSWTMRSKGRSEECILLTRPRAMSFPIKSEYMQPSM